MKPPAIPSPQRGLAHTPRPSTWNGVLSARKGDLVGEEALKPALTKARAAAVGESEGVVEEGGVAGEGAGVAVVEGMAAVGGGEGMVCDGDREGEGSAGGDEEKAGEDVAGDEDDNEGGSESSMTVMVESETRHARHVILGTRGALIETLIHAPL
ncbi:hypothetical protein DFH09DRAFT_1281562 [Mycena vulgaris]|nr:hypothetical protein DFH09DRAFT_1281562 [Mycena vulgaris]